MADLRFVLFFFYGPSGFVVVAQVGTQHTPLAVISRPVAGVRGSTLVVTLPGSPKAVKEVRTTWAFTAGLDKHSHLSRGGIGILPCHEDLVSGERY